MLLWSTPTRYYAVRVQRDLLGQIEVVRIWGGKGSRLGGCRRVPCQSWREALEEVRAVAKRRAARGYHRTC